MPVSPRSVAPPSPRARRGRSPRKAVPGPRTGGGGGTGGGGDTLLATARHAEEAHRRTVLHAAQLLELREQLEREQGDRRHWEAWATQLAARVEQEQLRLTSLTLAGSLHESTADASRARLASIHTRMAEASQIVTHAERDAAASRAAQVAAQQQAATAQAEVAVARAEAHAAQAELQLLRAASADGGDAARAASAGAVLDLMALPALRLEDSRARPPSSRFWAASWSVRYLRWFWFHTLTRETVWDWPTEVLDSPAGRELQSLLGVNPTAAASQATAAAVEEGVPGSRGRKAPEPAPEPEPEPEPREHRRKHQQQNQQLHQSTAPAAAAACAKCAALQKQLHKMDRKLTHVVTQKHEMGTNAKALQESVATFESELEGKIQAILAEVMEHYESQVRFQLYFIACYYLLGSLFGGKWLSARRVPAGAG